MGICLGMQIALIEYARDVPAWRNANSTEFDLETDIRWWPDRRMGEPDGKIEKRDENSNLGGTMRLGGQQCHLGRVRGDRVRHQIVERHRHRLRSQQPLRAALEAAGLGSQRAPAADERLVEMIELPNHPWFFACQFHPEFTSTRVMAIRCSGLYQAAIAHQSRPQLT